MSTTMNPSLMTERQQLAFLLRQTAQRPAHSSGSDSHSGAESSDGDGAGATASRRSKRIPRRHAANYSSARASAKHSTTGEAAAASTAHAIKSGATPRGRGRPPKRPMSSLQTHTPTVATDPNAGSSSDKPSPPKPELKADGVVLTHQRPEGAKRLKVSITEIGHSAHVEGETSAQGASGSDMAGSPSPKRSEKTSPSSSSDVLHRDEFESHQNDSWRQHCALCCQYTSAWEASSSDALFLCPKCDQKYPTQRALGLV